MKKIILIGLVFTIGIVLIIKGFVGIIESQLIKDSDFSSKIDKESAIMLTVTKELNI